MGLSPWLYAAGITSGTFNEARGGAVGNINTALLDLMLAHGADVNAQVTGAASYSGRIARSLTGDPVNTKSNEGMTALHVAVRSQNATLVRYLLDKGARTDIKDASGRTPLDVLNGVPAFQPAVFATGEGVVPPAAAAAPAGAATAGAGRGGGAGARSGGNPAAAQEIRTMAATFTRTDGDIRAVLQTMFTSAEFLSEGAWRAKFKSPLEVVISAARALNADVTDTYVLAQRIADLGQPLYGKVEPTGYPNTGEAWANSAGLLGRIDFASALTTGQIPGTRVDVSRFNFKPPAAVAADLLGIPPSAATLTAIEKGMANGRDITDEVIQFGAPNQPVASIEAIFTDRVNEVRGTVADDRANPVGGVRVVIYSSERNRWYPASRFMRSAVTNPDGTFSVTGLPSGSYFAAATLRTPLGDDAWGDPVFLDSLRGAATIVTLGEGQRQSVNLRAPSR